MHIEAPSTHVAARRDRAFFCIVGTLLAMAVVVYQGDYSGYAAALAERSTHTGTMVPNVQQEVIAEKKRAASMLHTQHQFKVMTSKMTQPKIVQHQAQVVASKKAQHRMVKLHTQGYAGTENVFDPGYKPPVLGHWVRKDDQGNMKWLSARAYIAKYGTDDPTNGNFLGHNETEISEAPSLVGEFGIDSNVFAQNYKAPSNDDHISVAVVHVDDKDADKKSQAKATGRSDVQTRLQATQRSQLTLLDELNVFDSDYKKPLQGHWVANPDRPGEQMWVNAQDFAAGGYQLPTQKPEIVHPGPSLVSAFGIDSNIFASNYQAPKPWSHGDHIAVAMVHVDESHSQGQAQAAKDKQPCGVNSVGAVCNPF